MQTPTTTVQLLALATAAARKGDIDTVERMFDVVSGWMLTTEAKYEIDCILADLCAIADGRDRA